MSRGYNATHPFEVWVENLLLPAFFRKISRLHIVRISAFRWTESQISALIYHCPSEITK